MILDDDNTRKFFIDLKDEICEQILKSETIIWHVYGTSDCIDATEGKCQYIKESTKSPLEIAFYIGLKTCESIGSFEDKEFDIEYQYQIENYFIDFVIIYKNKKLAIDIDGFNYHDRNAKEFDKSRERQNTIIKNGFDYYVFTYRKIKKEFNDIIEKIQLWLYSVDRI